MFHCQPSSGYRIDYTYRIESEHSYVIDVERDRHKSARFQHVFCGQHAVHGAWCPNCSKPLLRFLKIDGNDERAKILTHVDVSLFFCWTCNISQADTLVKPSLFALSAKQAAATQTSDWYSSNDTNYVTCLLNEENEPVGVAPFYYKIIPNGGVTLLQYKKGGRSNDFPYKNYPQFFPETSVDLLELSEPAQTEIIALNIDENDEGRDWSYTDNHPEIEAPMHQLGGEPLLVQKDRSYRMPCPQCAVIMPFFAAIADYCLDSRGFVGRKYVQVIYHYCHSCTIVGCFQQAD